MASRELLDWLVQGGGCVHPHVKFESNADGERGIFASSPLPAGTELISVPHALCLHVPRPPHDAQVPAANTTGQDAEEPSRKKAKLATELGSSADVAKTPAAQWLAPQVDAIGEFAAAVLLLMAETAAGAASPFAPAIAALPATHHSVMAWSTAEAARLRGTTIANELPDTRGFFDHNIAPVAARRCDLWPKNACLYEAFLQAAGMVQTRTFRIHAVDLATGARLGGSRMVGSGHGLAAGASGKPRDETSGGDEAKRRVLPASLGGRRKHGSSGGSSVAGGNTAQSRPSGECGDAEQQRFLVPVIDYANHSTLPAGVNAELRLGGGSSSGLRFALDARRDIASGEEIRISYGPLSDGELVLTYGFVEALSAPAVNPNNKAVLAENDVQEAATMIHRLTGAGDKDTAGRRWKALAEGGLLQPPYELTAAHPIPDNLLNLLMIMAGGDDEWTDVQSSMEQTEGFLDEILRDMEDDVMGDVVVVLLRLGAQAQRRNPLHGKISKIAKTSKMSEEKALAQFLYGSPRPAGEANAKSANAAGASYRRWCAHRVAAGELHVLNSLDTEVGKLAAIFCDPLRPQGW